MNRSTLASLTFLFALSAFAGKVEEPRPFDARLVETQGRKLAIDVELGDRLSGATDIYFIVEVFNSADRKVGQFSAKSAVPSGGKRRMISLDLPPRMETAKTVTVWASGYRRRNSDVIMPVSYPPECGSFCLVGRNECNLYCAEQNSNVAMYRCYYDGYYCYYDCLCN